MFRVIGGIAVTAAGLAVLSACGDDAPEVNLDAMAADAPVDATAPNTPTPLPAATHTPSPIPTATPTKPGDLRWRYKTGHFVVSSPAVVDGVVYVGSGDRYLYVVSMGRWIPAFAGMT